MRCGTPRKGTSAPGSNSTRVGTLARRVAIHPPWSVGEALGDVEAGALRDGQHDLARGVRDPQGDALGRRTPPEGHLERAAFMGDLQMRWILGDPAEQGKFHVRNLPCGMLPVSAAVCRWPEPTPDRPPERLDG